MHPHKPTGIQGGQNNHGYLRGKRIDPPAITGRESACRPRRRHVPGLQRRAPARGRASCSPSKMLEPDVTVGLTLTGALTPAGLGMSALIPLIEAGFVDWIVSTGANLYHDTHFGLGLAMHRGTPRRRRRAARRRRRAHLRHLLRLRRAARRPTRSSARSSRAPEFQRTMSSAEFHYRVRQVRREREEELGSPAARCSPRRGSTACRSTPRRRATRSIGMNVAAKALEGNRLAFDVIADVNETAAHRAGRQARPAARAAC